MKKTKDDKIDDALEELRKHIEFFKTKSKYKKKMDYIEEELLKINIDINK